MKFRSIRDRHSAPPCGTRRRDLTVAARGTGRAPARAGLMRTRSFRATFVPGIDGLQRPLDAPAGAASGDHRPPYDVERILGFEGFGDSLRPIFAVAGFAPEQLEITVLGDQLFLSGEQSGDVDPQRCLYRAIAARRFRRVFRLAGSLGVERAAPSNGLLSICGNAARDESVGP